MGGVRIFNDNTYTHTRRVLIIHCFIIFKSNIRLVLRVNFFIQILLSQVEDLTKKLETQEEPVKRNFSFTSSEVQVIDAWKLQ